MVEKYWEVKLDFVCMICAKVSHDPLGEYGDISLQYVIYTRDHKVKYYIYGVTR